MSKREDLAIGRVESLQQRRNVVLWGQILSSEWGQILKPSHKADALVSVYGVPLEETVFTPFLESMEGQGKKCQNLASVWSGGDSFHLRKNYSSG